MSKILDIIDGNLACEWQKWWKKRFQHYVAAAGLIDNKKKRVVLLHLSGPAGQEIFDAPSDTGDDYESAILNLDSYFMPKKNLIYKRYDFLIAMQNSAETIDAYVTRQQLITKSCDYGGFEEEIIRDHVVMNCVSSRLRRLLLREKDLSLLNFSKQLRGQRNYQIIRHQKWKAFSNIMTVCYKEIINSSNVNEVNRAVLNLFTKRFRAYKKNKNTSQAKTH